MIKVRLLSLQKFQHRRLNILIVPVVATCYSEHHRSEWSLPRLCFQKEVIDLHDNSPFHEHIYLVTVFTGNRPNSGTTANVALRLHGTEAKSDVHLIQVRQIEEWCKQLFHLHVVIIFQCSMLSLILLHSRSLFSP